MLPLLSTSGTLRIIGTIQEISRITKQMEMDKEMLKMPGQEGRTLISF